MEASVDPQPRGPDWMPITPTTRSLFHAETHPELGKADTRVKGDTVPKDMQIGGAEVDDAFEVPLAFLMNPANHQLQSKEFRGVERFFYAMPYGERYIWGATAGILRVLYERIFAS